MRYESNSPQETEKIGNLFGGIARRGSIYTLSGDLGTGKTVLSQGFAKGLGIREIVNSPTFTIVNEYTTGVLPFYHFDVYRISDPDEMYAIGFEEYFYGDGVCLVEWSELIEELLPPDALRVRIRKDLEKGFDYRSIEIS